MVVAKYGKRKRTSRDFGGYGRQQQMSDIACEASLRGLIDITEARLASYFQLILLFPIIKGKGN